MPLENASMWSLPSSARGRILVLTAFVLVVMAGGTARALPQCGPAEPATVGVTGQYAQNSWNNYRDLPAEHRCCAKPCEPLGRFAGKLEQNAIALNAVARNPQVPKTERDQALANANALFKQRTDRTFEFLQCIAQTRPRGTGAAAHCGEVLIPYRTLGWIKWCDAFAARLQGFRDLLIKTVGNNVGTWQVQSNWVRIQNNGLVDGLVRVESSSSRLPAGKSPTPFPNYISDPKFSFPEFPVISAVQSRMYMRFTARAIRLPGPSGTKALDTSVLIDGVCPGPVNRPSS